MDQQRPQVGYLSQLAIILGLTGFFLVAGAAALALITKLMHIPLSQLSEATSANGKTLGILNTALSVFIFLGPAIAFAWIVGRRPLGYLGLTTGINAWQAGLVVILTIAAMFLGGALTTLTLKIPLSSEWLAAAKKYEDQYQDMVMAMAQMKNTKDLLLVFVVLACAPAIFEELFFRGMIQQFLVNWSKKPFISILVTSIIFSAVHLSYFGFLPRLALGMVLGYIFYYTKSIWLNILLHLVNNGYIVMALYIASRQGKLQEAIASDSEALPLYVGVIALALICVLFVILRRVTPRRTDSPTGLSFPLKPIFND